jgi:hypothetical protein
MTDLIDRFTATDACNACVALSRLSLGRGFLLRRLSGLIFENLSDFQPGQLVQILHAMAKLRFLTAEQAEQILDEVEKSHGILSVPF